MFISLNDHELYLKLDFEKLLAHKDKSEMALSTKHISPSIYLDFVLE